MRSGTGQDIGGCPKDKSTLLTQSLKVVELLKRRSKFYHCQLAKVIFSATVSWISEGQTWWNIQFREPQVQKTGDLILKRTERWRNRKWFDKGLLSRAVVCGAPVSTGQEEGPGLEPVH